MSDSKLDIVSAFKFEKSLRALSAVYLSAILLLVGCVLITVDMNIEMQQVLVVILGLVAVATLDAFRKAVGDTSSIANKFEQIVVQDGGVYVVGGYQVHGNINRGNQRTQPLAEAAAEIQDLLKQLEQSNPSATEEEQVAYVNEETPPALKSRVASAVRSGSDTALRSILDSSPYGNVAKAVIEGWLSISSDQADGTINDYGNDFNDVMNLITVLRSKAQALPNDHKDDVFIELDDLETDIQRLKPNQNRINLRLKRLAALAAAIGSAAGGAAMVSSDSNDFVRNISELAEALSIPMEEISTDEL